MRRIVSRKVLTYMATTAEEAFLEALGLASKGGMYEPAIPMSLINAKSEHTSRFVRLYEKILG